MSDNVFTEIEIEYLRTQTVGRLATIQPDGTPQASPVGFTYNAELGTIDIGGFNLSQSRKFRNLAGNDKVAFVVDDVPSANPPRVRCLEIRGIGEQVHGITPSMEGLDSALIRVHPRRIISFGIDAPDTAPHELVASRRNVR